MMFFQWTGIIVLTIFCLFLIVQPISGFLQMHLFSAIGGRSLCSIVKESLGLCIFSIFLGICGIVGLYFIYTNVNINISFSVG